MINVFVWLAENKYVQGGSIIIGFIGFILTIGTLVQTCRVSTAIRKHESAIHNREFFPPLFENLKKTSWGITEELSLMISTQNYHMEHAFESIPSINDFEIGIAYIQKSIASNYNWFSSLSFRQKKIQIYRLRRLTMQIQQILSQSFITTKDLRKLKKLTINLCTILEQELTDSGWYKQKTKNNRQYYQKDQGTENEVE